RWTPSPLAVGSERCVCWPVTEDGSRPSEVGLQERTSNHPVLLHPKGVVVSDRGKVIPEDGR
ncbi:hypothetical protein ACTTYI_006558, partial [Pseudomonas aeruginosa]